MVDRRDALFAQSYDRSQEASESGQEGGRLQAMTEVRSLQLNQA